MAKPEKIFALVMSDCSTNAMKPKEPPCFEPKTCGNCGHSVVCSAQNKGDDWDYCNQWIPESTDTLEQRYQQLEQVARELLAMEEYETGRKNRVFRSRLRRAGVRPDD